MTSLAQHRVARGISVSIGCFVLMAVCFSAAQTSQEFHGVAVVGSNLSQPKLKTIFSNLGPKGDRYDCNNGWLVIGTAVPDVWSTWIAMPFTPTATATVTQIKIAMTIYDSYPFAFTLSLNADSSGLPGKALHTWEMKKLNASCPNTLDAATYKRGIKVSKGKQYWVVAQTDSTNANTVDSWNYVDNDATGPFAYDIANAGWTAYNSNLSAFAVYGH